MCFHFATAADTNLSCKSQGLRILVSEFLERILIKCVRCFAIGLIPFSHLYRYVAIQ